MPTQHQTTAICYGSENAPTFIGEHNEVVSNATKWVENKRKSFNDKNRWKINEGYGIPHDKMPFGFTLSAKFEG